MFSNAAASRRNRLNVTYIVWTLVLIAFVGNICCLPLEEFYPFSEADNKTDKTDDGGSDKIHLTPPFPFYNSTYSYVYVNNNGIISFDRTLDTYKPSNFNHSEFKKDTPPLVAPYWADVDIENIKNVNGLNASITFNLTTEGSVLKRVDEDVRKNFIGQKNFTAELVLIVTWYNVGFYGATQGGLEKRNTFQCVLATSGTASFAIFNYNSTVWTTGSNSEGATETGLGGKPAVVGFYSGADGRYYLLDHSGSDEIKNISNRTNVGTLGKYMFRLDGGIDDLSCSAKVELQIVPKSVSMLGREAVVVSGPCLTGSLTVKGRIKELELEFNCQVLGDLAVCVLPYLFRTGDLTFELDPYNEGWKFSTKITSVHLLNTPPKLHRNTPDKWVAGNTVSVSWSNDTAPANLEKTLKVLAYTIKDGKPMFEEIASDLQVERGETSRKFKLISDYNGHSTLVTALCWQNIQHPNLLSRCIWTDVFPARWKDSELTIINDSKVTKSEQWCIAWLEKEKSMEPIKIHPQNQNCPCIESIAENDYGKFSSDPNCDNTSVNTNCVYNKNAHKCFRRNNKGALDSGETCCYDNEGYLMDIRVSSGAGTHQRYHYKAQGEGITPYFSYFESDLLPKLHCCQYSDRNCTDFIKYRNATMCRNYTPPSPAQAAGDPHLVTLDGKGYSFNGVGSFYLVTDQNTSVVVQVQAVQAKDDKGDLQNATVFTQVAMAMPGISDIVEIKKTENGSEVLVNKQIIPTTNSTTSQFNRKLRGLLGNYNGKPEDDFISRNETVFSESLNMRQIHYDFGMTWQVPENESILSAASVELSSDIVFQPVFIDEKKDVNLPNDSYDICGENEQCKFDYAVTRKKSIALSTAQFVSKFEAIRQQLDQKVVRCLYLDTPSNGNITLTGFAEGDVATYTCNPNYEMVQGSSIRKCQGNSEWSGSDVVCAENVVQESNLVIVTVVAIASSAGTVLLVIVCVVIICIKRRQRKEHGVEPQDFPLPTISNIPIFENPVFMKMLHDTTSDGRFRIPRPNYVDPSIFQEYF